MSEHRQYEGPAQQIFLSEIEGINLNLPLSQELTRIYGTQRVGWERDPNELTGMSIFFSKLIGALGHVQHAEEARSKVVYIYPDGVEHAINREQKDGF
ncbi:MAG: hypothetical protein JWL85_69 [Candidatus Saccharibacteria bacterium]|nr:hypothetical protein [Candidatus Saccharibacteria bacterium]